MNTETYKTLVQEIESLVSEVLNEQPACDFSEDAPELFEMDADFNEIWSDRS